VSSRSSGQPLKTAIPPLHKILLSLLAADFAVLLRHRQSLVLGMVLPLIILIGAAQSSGDFANRFGGPAVPLGSSITIGMMSTALLGYSIATARDRERGIFQRLRVTPAPTWTIMVSRLTVQVIASLLMLVVILLADYLLNNVSLGIGEYLLTLLLTVVGAAVFLSIAQALVGLVKSADTVTAAGRIIYIALILNGVLAATGSLGTTVQSIARWTPSGTVSAMLAGAALPAAWNADNWLAVLASIAYILVFAGIGIRWFQWSAG